jgi:formate hydrogenlyase transcriptional activator
MRAVVKPFCSEDGELLERRFEQIVGNSAALERVLQHVALVAPTDSTVLIEGETGTGKELIARSIHNISSRRGRPFVTLNCAAIPSGLIESELFGHEKGAFTGAVERRVGRFESAHSGTIFLDEIGEIPLELQPKLLRVLQEQEFERLGSTRTVRVDVRVVAATNRDLRQMAEEGKFRSDLYYRLSVFPLLMPPLRERSGDIPLLARFFADKFARRMNKTVDSISEEAMCILSAYHWPGNIRELQNVIERAVILCQGGRLQVDSVLRESVSRRSDEQLRAAANDSDGTVFSKEEMDRLERRNILAALEKTNWKIYGPGGAAEMLGVKPSTLASRVTRMGLKRPARDHSVAAGAGSGWAMAAQ